MATYYVAEGGTAGTKENADGDGYPGGYLSVADHNAETFAAGDTINVVSDGGVIRSMLVPPSPGSSGNNIVYEFDSDVELNAADLFDASWEVHNGNVWKVAATTEVKDLHYDGTQGALQVSADACTALGHWYWASNVLYFYSGAGDPGSGYTSPGVEGSVRNRCFDTDVGYLTLNGNGADCRYSTGYGFALYGAPGSRSIGSIVQDFIVHDVMYGFGQVTQGFTAVSVQDTTIRRIKAYRCGWNGIQLTVWSTGEAAFTGNVIEQCYAYDNDHSGFDVHNINDSSPMTGVVFRHNRAHNNHEEGMYFFNESSGPNGNISGTICMYNVSYANGKGGITFDQNGDGGYHDGCVIVGNTSYGNSTIGGGTGCGIFAKVTDSVLYNNICAQNNVIENTSEEIRVESGGGTGNIVDYNLVYNPNETDLYREDGDFYTHAEYQSFGQQAHGLNEDPKFTNAGTGDFTLASDSPCIGAGSNLGASYDDALLPGSTWTGGVLTGDQDDY